MTHWFRKPRRGQQLRSDAISYDEEEEDSDDSYLAMHRRNSEELDDSEMRVRNQEMDDLFPGYRARQFEERRRRRKPESY